MIHIYIKFRCEGVRQNIDTKRIKNYAEWYYSNDLAPHFKFEEEYVFSILGIDNDLIKKALTQHRRLKKYFTKYIESEKSLSRIEEELETLIRFEERTVFPAIRNNIKINRILLSPEVFPYKLNAKEWDDLFWRDHYKSEREMAI